VSKEGEVGRMRARQECRMRGTESIERGKENLSFSITFQKEVKREGERVEREREKEEEEMGRGGEGKKEEDRKEEKDNNCSTDECSYTNAHFTSSSQKLCKRGTFHTHKKAFQITSSQSSPYSFSFPPYLPSPYPFPPYPYLPLLLLTPRYFNISAVNMHIFQIITKSKGSVFFKNSLTQSFEKLHDLN
jgi:hypothetical protein